MVLGIEVCGLSLYVGDCWLFDNLLFMVFGGQWVLLFGVSGVGKISLLWVMVGLVFVICGEVVVSDG